MPAPKKAAKKVAKKAAKKVPAKHAHPEAQGKDMRRAYEHLGRVEVLHPALPKGAAAEIATLSGLARQELTAGHAAAAADLLRAAEHLSFGALHAAGKHEELDPQLVEALEAEFDHKLRKAKEHWSADEHGPLAKIYEAAVASAQSALEEGAYRRALELARAAEVLAHVTPSERKALPAGTAQRRLPV